MTSYKVDLCIDLAGKHCLPGLASLRGKCSIFRAEHQLPAIYQLMFGDRIGQARAIVQSRLNGVPGQETSQPGHLRCRLQHCIDTGWYATRPML